MGWFGKTEYEKQWEESARQQAEAARQQAESARQQERAREFEDKSDRLFAISKANHERSTLQIEETAILIEMQRQNAERTSRLLDTCEALGRRLDAFLTKWEQRG